MYKDTYSYTVEEDTIGMKLFYISQNSYGIRYNSGGYEWLIYTLV